MKRFTGLIAVLAGLGLLLTGCVPLDGNAGASGPSASAEATSDAPAPSAQLPSIPVPLQSYSAEGLEQRISGLPPEMAAYGIQRGLHPFEDGVPGSEHVVLAERFSSSTNFELPAGLPGDRIGVELTCSTSVPYSIAVTDDAGTEISGGFMNSCNPDGPGGMRAGLGASREFGQVQVRFDGDTEMVLSVVVYTGSSED